MRKYWGGPEGQERILAMALASGEIDFVDYLSGLAGIRQAPGGHQVFGRVADPADIEQAQAVIREGVALFDRLTGRARHAPFTGMHIHNHPAHGHPGANADGDHYHLHDHGGDSSHHHAHNNHVGTVPA